MAKCSYCKHNSLSAVSTCPVCGRSYRTGKHTEYTSKDDDIVSPAMTQILHSSDSDYSSMGHSSSHDSSRFDGGGGDFGGGGATGDF